MKKAYLDIQFSWIFAIIVGAIILFFAIFMVVKLVKTESSSQNVQTSKEISVLLNSLETSYEQGVSSLISLPQYSRIYSTCSASGNFGSQGILVNEKIYGKWKESKIPLILEDKYLFIDNYAESREFYVFSKPFEFPFKIATLTYLTSSNQQYCFINPPTAIRDEIIKLEQDNFVVSESNCTSESPVKICYSSGFLNCDINVKYSENFLVKDGKTYWFVDDASMYAGIFSTKEQYECQMKRLVKRVNSLSEIYKEKILLNTYSTCKSDVLNELESFIFYLNSYSDSKDFKNSRLILTELESENKYSGCRLW